jgi:hypothetical protein
MAEITTIGRVRIAVESTFATDGTGTIGNFFSVRVDQGSFKPAGPKRAQIPVEPLRSFRGQKRANALGFKHGTLEAGGQLCSIGTEIANGVTTTKDGISKLFEQLFGGYRTGEGSVVATATSTTEIIVSGGDGGQFLAGQLIFVETAVGSALYIPAVVVTRSTDTLTLTPAMPAGAGAVGAKVLNTQMVFESDQPTGTVQWLAEVTRDRDHIYLYMGCTGSVSFEWPLGEAVKWSTSQQVTSWVHDDELAGAQGGSSLSIYSLDAGTPVIGRGNSVFFGPSAVSTRVTPTVLDLTFNPGMSYTPVPSHNGVEGRAGYEAMSGTPGGTITLLAGTETYRDAFEAQTVYRILAQAGNVGGKQIALHLPNVVITDISFEEMNGMLVEKLTYECLPADGFADQSTDVLRSRFYLGRG